MGDKKGSFPCPCCGNPGLAAVGEFEICDVCGWEDDPVQEADPNFAGGANKLSLNDFRKQWAEKLMKARGEDLAGG